LVVSYTLPVVLDGTESYELFMQISMSNPAGAFGTIQHFNFSAELHESLSNSTRHFGLSRRNSIFVFY